MTDSENTQVNYINEVDVLEYLLPLSTVEGLTHALLINRILTKALRMSKFVASEHYPMTEGLSPKMAAYHSLVDDGTNDKSTRSVYNNYSWISCADLRNDKSAHDIGYESVVALRTFSESIRPDNLLKYTEGWLAGEELLNAFATKDPKVSLTVDKINESKDRDQAACIYYDLPESAHLDIKELIKEDKRVLYFVYADQQFLMTAVVHRGL